MTEAEWHTCTDTNGMLTWLHATTATSTRKLRLFGCGCCRRVWERLTDERSRRAVEVAERFADGLAGEVERKRAQRAAEFVVTTFARARPLNAGQRAAAEAAAWAAHRAGPVLAVWATRAVDRGRPDHFEADLLR